MVVMDMEGNAIAEVGISYEEYIFRQPSEFQLSWWGPGSAEEGGEMQKQMYAVKFGRENEGIMKRVLDVIERVLQEHAAERKIEGPICGDGGLYDDNAFEFKTGVLGGGDSDDGVVWMDAEEGQLEQAVCRDSTRVIAAKNATSRVHKLMYVGSSRTFVVRGTAAGARVASGAKEGDVEMQVLKWKEETDGGASEVVATIDGKKLEYEGKLLCPTRGLLQGGEQKMVMLNEGDAEKVYMMDVEKEKVVQAWSAGDMTIQNLIPKNKDAPLTYEPTFIGSNPTAIFEMDTRTSTPEKSSTKWSNKVGGATGAASARGTTLSYATNVQFTCGTTDAKGHVLMGSKTGDLRLYDGEPNKDGKFKRAKTHLQGLGDPLQHVAVTRDGAWILGTCAKYLVLFPVRLASSGKTGFVTALGKAKPPPIILKLTMDDMVRYSLTDVNFVKAEFNADETAIVTSTGNLAVVWDFARAVKLGGSEDGAEATPTYTIRAVGDYIKDVDFMRAGGLESIVMATPCDVTTKPILNVAV